MVRAEAHIGIGRQMEHEVRTGHGARDGVEVQQVALDEAEARMGLRTLEKAPESGGEVVERRDVVA